MRNVLTLPLLSPFMFPRYCPSSVFCFGPIWGLFFLVSFSCELPWEAGSCGDRSSTEYWYLFDREV